MPANAGVVLGTNPVAASAWKYAYSVVNHRHRGGKRCRFVGPSRPCAWRACSAAPVLQYGLSSFCSWKGAQPLYVLNMSTILFWRYLTGVLAGGS